LMNLVLLSIWWGNTLNKYALLVPDTPGHPLVDELKNLISKTGFPWLLKGLTP
jgi:hypothetical protein